MSPRAAVAKKSTRASRSAPHIVVTAGPTREYVDPVRYLSNMLTAGKDEPVVTALERMLAMRAFMRAKTVDGLVDASIAERVGLDVAQIEDMYHTMAIANYEDRFVIPTGHREADEDAYDLRGSCGFSFGNGCSGGDSKTGLFGMNKAKKAKSPMEVS